MFTIHLIVGITFLSKNLHFNKDSPKTDLYIRYLFRLKWEVKNEWRIVLGVSKVSGLKKFKEVSDPQKERELSAPEPNDRTNFGTITLERGITADLEFDKWATSTLKMKKTAKNLANFKRNLLFEILNENLSPVARYMLFGCWVSEYSISDFDANANDVAIETIKVEIESWHRDTDFTDETK